MSDEAADLLARFRNGDPQAASELFLRYSDRLVALARSRLSTRLNQRLDPEDVVQSAYRSFFAAVRAGRYGVDAGGDLWRLLVTITLHKVHHQFKRNTADRRSVARERNLDVAAADGRLPDEVLAREPTPVEAIALTELVEEVMRELEPLHRRMLELRLQGHSVEEIAAVTERSERTVRRLLERVKEQLVS